MLGDCLSSAGSFAADVAKDIGINAATGLGKRWWRQNWFNSDNKHRPGSGNHSHKNLRPQCPELCEKSENSAACYHRERNRAPWEGLSDAEF